MTSVPSVGHASLQERPEGPIILHGIWLPRKKSGFISKEGRRMDNEWETRSLCLKKRRERVVLNQKILPRLVM